MGGTKASAKKAKVEVKTETKTSSAPQPARLPKLRLKDQEQLHLQGLYPLHVQGSPPTIWALRGALTRDEAHALQEALVAMHPLVRCAHAQTRSIAWRDVDRVEFRSPQLSELVWATGMDRCLEEGIELPKGLVWAGLNTKWRIYKYGEGQGFGPHFDEEDLDPTTQLHSHYTLLLYLSEPRVGGETTFYKSRGHEVLSIKPEVGLMVVHAQGSQCLLHEGRPVGKGGDKWVLRSDVMVAPQREEPEAAA